MEQDSRKETTYKQIDHTEIDGLKKYWWNQKIKTITGTDIVAWDYG